MLRLSDIVVGRKNYFLWKLLKNLLKIKLIISKTKLELKTCLLKKNN